MEKSLSYSLEASIQRQKHSYRVADTFTETEKWHNHTVKQISLYATKLKFFNRKKAFTQRMKGFQYREAKNSKRIS